MDDNERLRYCTNKFIALANELKNEKISPEQVNGALMMASGIFATFIAAGNDGALEPSGVEKVTNLYRRTLDDYQKVKKGQLKKPTKT